MLVFTGPCKNHARTFGSGKDSFLVFFSQTKCGLRTMPVVQPDFIHGRTDAVHVGCEAGVRVGPQLVPDVCTLACQEPGARGKIVLVDGEQGQDGIRVAFGGGHSRGQRRDRGSIHLVVGGRLHVAGAFTGDNRKLAVAVLEIARFVASKSEDSGNLGSVKDLKSLHGTDKIGSRLNIGVALIRVECINASHGAGHNVANDAGGRCSAAEKAVDFVMGRHRRNKVAVEKDEDE